MFIYTSRKFQIMSDDIGLEFIIFFFLNIKIVSMILFEIGNILTINK